MPQKSTTWAHVYATPLFFPHSLGPETVHADGLFGGHPRVQLLQRFLRREQHRKPVGEARAEARTISGIGRAHKSVLHADQPQVILRKNVFTFYREHDWFSERRGASRKEGGRSVGDGACSKREWTGVCVRIPKPPTTSHERHLRSVQLGA